MVLAPLSAGIDIIRLATGSAGVGVRHGRGWLITFTVSHECCAGMFCHACKKGHSGTSAQEWCRQGVGCPLTGHTVPRTHQRRIHNSCQAFNA